MTNDAQTFTALSLADLRTRYLVHARLRYRRRGGAQSREASNIAGSTGRFIAFCGPNNSSNKINRHHLRDWLNSLAAEELSRTFCNQSLSRVRKMFRWGAELDLLNMSVCEQLRLVQPLAPFQSGAKEKKERKPPSLEEARKILPYMPRMPRDCLQLVMLSACRPSELLELRNSEIHLDGRGARLNPAQHKCAHRNIARVIPLSKAALKIIDKYWRPFLPDDYVFATIRTPERTAPTHYCISALESAVKKACIRAGVKPFLPYDIRHAVGRAVRKAKGLDHAQALLGHTNSRTTEIYAPLPPEDVATYITAAAAAEVLQ